MPVWNQMRQLAGQKLEVLIRDEWVEFASLREDVPEAVCIKCRESYPVGQMRWTTDPYMSEIHGEEKDEGWWCDHCWTEANNDV